VREKSYKIRVGGYRGSSGTGTISLSIGPANPTATTLEADFAEFSRCLIGPRLSTPAGSKGDEDACCHLQDYDADGDGDLGDFAVFASAIEPP
jgi:hypothetical protein